MNTGEKNIDIRPAVLQDIPYIYEICLQTSDSGKDGAKLFHDRYLVGSYYAASYLCYPNSLCFVLDLGGIPAGYLVAVPDTSLYNYWLETSWLPPLRLRYASGGRYQSEAERLLIESCIHKTHSPEPALPAWRISYPAHLHIDILPRAQGAGWGRKLIARLCAGLKEQGISGVHLGVGMANTDAITFYRKTGFTVLSQERWGVIMGKSIAALPKL